MCYYMKTDTAMNAILHKLHKCDIYYAFPFTGFMVYDNAP